jgi:hypothetical protein
MINLHKRLITKLFLLVDNRLARLNVKSRNLHVFGGFLIKRAFIATHIAFMRYKQKLIQQGVQMAKPNYSYEKRQKEIAKKKKQEEKRNRKQGNSSATEEPAQRSVE